ncbi:MAG TPA: hypothetical protein VMR86_15255 [Myxococcota bacterium]|nr:hypothetical protein [Myxococcota bacterium]
MSRVSLILAALLALCAPAAARAGGPGFGNPLQNGCGTIYLVDDMQDPSYFVSNAHSMTVKLCDSLCKQAAAECAQVVKESAACTFKAVSKAEFFADAACADADGGSPSDLKTCKSNVHVNVASVRAEFRGFLITELGRCTSWGTDCVTQCATLGM